ncbi:type II toxin-antitoxin system RelE/ParE family toxin [Massilia sp. BJB1822]|uniref:type II toxin-antitoxin system RelE/ParE family toxin n=1 Tax=Massilia sp. BJB1822 TaxID=2744470 RepID=UPI001594B3E6|nr:type II toxin-antitoxin system RelE/ParE family toxin [Massilia sp. BJB1822]NVD97010.1 type II toxin-antitoxin system RelE/ParE family toxin [Massilia sp. BJB1822]
MYEIVYYVQADGRTPLQEWLRRLPDRQTRARILIRFQRLAAGNFGDCKPITEGIWELHLDFGPGFRVYYGRAGKKLLPLLCAGDKGTQQTDIDHALLYWRDWRTRNQS